jgi:hypothetical protein
MIQSCFELIYMYFSDPGPVIEVPTDQEIENLRVVIGAINIVILITLWYSCEIPPPPSDDTFF